jgi:hypothetical protein
MEFAARLEFASRPGITCMGWMIPLCRWSLPRLCGFPRASRAGRRSTSSPVLLSGFAFLQSITRSILADRLQPAGSSHGLFSPSAHTGLEGPRFAGFALPRFGPPSGFAYPPGGFRPSNPGRFCFIPAALLGFFLGVVLSPGIRHVSARMHPHTVSSAVVSADAFGRPARQTAVPGFWPRQESLEAPHGFNSAASRMTPRFLPFQGTQRRP